MRTTTLSLVAALAVALTPLSAPGAQAAADAYSNTAATAVVAPLGQPVAFGAPQPNATEKTNVANQWYKFTIETPSLVTISATAPAPAYDSANTMSVTAYYADATTILPDLSGQGGYFRVASDTMPTDQRLLKLMPGDYYVNGSNTITSQNGYAVLTVTAQPTAADTGGEPNDSPDSAKFVQFGTTYTGNIGYAVNYISIPVSTPPDSSTIYSVTYSTHDRDDYYLVKIPQDNYKLKGVFTVAGSGTPNSVTAQFETSSRTSLVYEGIQTLSDATPVTMTSTFLKKGTYILHITSGTAVTEYTFQLTVVKTPVKAIKLSKTKLTLKKGKSATLKATVKPRGATATVKWSSSNSKIAKVNSKGKVTAKKKGKAYIYAKADGKSAKCKVTVK
ncbi:MAG: Ig-like domain-containing protein [Propionibacteriaceae bacterium]|jgi:uncharacterized protein YjdB|nr:Ig-like domain-containing protein [Propionibacteriaceae bacterium]